MALQVKYRLRYDSRKYGNEYRFDILTEGFEGEITMVGYGGAEEQSLNRDAGKKINGTYVDLKIVCTQNFQFDEFFTYDNKKFKGVLYKNEVAVWSGYLVSDELSEPYIRPPYHINIQFTDGLGLLKNEKFELAGMVSHMEALHYCISKTSLALEYMIMCDVYESRMVTNRASFEQLYFDAEIYSGLSCYEVIEKLLPENVIISQYNNRWLIHRPIFDDYKQHFLYDSNGIYSGLIDGLPKLNLGSLGGVETDIFPIGYATRSFKHAWQSVKITQDYGKKESFLKNYDFSDSMLSYWNVLGDNFEIREQSDGNRFLFINGINANLSPSHNIRQTINVEASNSSFVFLCEYSAVSHSFSDPEDPTNSQVWFLIRLDYSGGTLYLTKKGWSNEFSYIIEESESSYSLASISWKNIKIHVDKIPYDGQLSVRIYKFHISVHKSIVYYGIAVNKVIFMTDDYSDCSNDDVQELIIRENSSLKGEDIVLKPCDLPDVINSRLAFSNGNYVFNGSGYVQASKWFENFGSKSEMSYLQLLKNQLNFLHGTPFQSLKGRFRGPSLSLFARVKHAFNAEREFIITEGRHLFLLDQWELTMNEIPGSATDRKWILESTNWDDTGVWDDYKNWND